MKISPAVLQCFSMVLADPAFAEVEYFWLTMQFRMEAQNAHKTTKGVAKDLQPAVFGIEWIHLAAK